MRTIRRSEERGHANHGWLDTHHTFSFANYYHPDFMGFRALRVLNDDRVSPGEGFPRHPHRDMEIVTYVLEGALEHKDSLGTGSVIRPGDVQRMSAGTGIVHSEFNHSEDEALRFLQIWIVPELHGGPPAYEQKTFTPAERKGQLRLVASPDGEEGSITLRQDARMYASLLDAGDRAEHVFASGRHGWVQVARGSVRLDSDDLGEGDGVALSDVDRIVLEGISSAEVLLFDLA
jgi:hypothetical protein